MMTQWDESFDFVVMGSGAAGLGAALRAHDLGLSTLVLEKSEFYGGSTAMSGGVCRVPDNPNMAYQWHSSTRPLALLQNL